MQHLKNFLVIVRPFQCLTAAFAVIAFGGIATKHPVPSMEVIAAAVAMALLVLASSAYHCAFQNHDKPFTRRVNDYIPRRRPWLLGSIAGLAFLASISISATQLPVLCTGAITITAGLVVLYTRFRGVAPLNPLIGVICSAPVLTGWSASGAPLSGWSYFFMAFAYLFYLVREDMKDSQEIGFSRERSECKRDENDDAPWGGTQGLYYFFPTLGTAFFAASYLGYGDLHPIGLYLLYLATFCIFALGLYMQYVEKNRRLYPQGVMTAFVWGYLLMLLMAMPGGIVPTA